MKINRKDFVKVLKNVMPSVSTQDFIDMMKNFCLDGETIFGYNDSMSIRLDFETGLEIAVPAESLLKIVDSYKSEEAEIYAEEDIHKFNIKCGRSKLSLPCLYKDSFIFSMPEDKNDVSIPINDKLIDGIKKCLISVGGEEIHTSHMGVTLIINKQVVSLYSTDNDTISRYSFKYSELDINYKKSVVLPKDFCVQLLNLCQSDSTELVLYDDYVGAYDKSLCKDSIFLFSKLLYTGKVEKFEEIFNRVVPKKPSKSLLIPIGESFKTAIDRSLIVLGGTPNKACNVSLIENRIEFSTVTALGEVEDKVTFKDRNFKRNKKIISADYVARAIKVCSYIYFGEEALAFFDGSAGFVHVVAYCSATNK